MKEFNRENIGNGPIKGLPTITIRKNGNFEVSQTTAGMLDLPHLAVKFFEDNDKFFIATSDDDNAFRLRAKAKGAMFQCSAMAHYILEKCGQNIYSVTLYISDKPISGLYEINLTPIRERIGSPE